MQSEAYQSISKALGGVSCAGSGGGSTRRCCVGLSMQNRRSALAAVRVPLSASTSYSKSRPRPRPTAFSHSHWHCAGRRVEATLEGLNFNSFAGERASARALRILGQHLARIQCGCHCTILHLLLLPLPAAARPLTPSACCSFSIADFSARTSVWNWEIEGKRKMRLALGHSVNECNRHKLPCFKLSGRGRGG